MRNKLAGEFLLQRDERLLDEVLAAGACAR